MSEWKDGLNKVDFAADERARQIYDEMMKVLEKHGDDKKVVHSVLFAFVGAYWEFVRGDKAGGAP